LANIFGRNRIEPRFESTFRTAVRESAVHQLGALLDVVLHDGAGPTVQRNLRDRRCFSTVVQLSLLLWNINLESLSNGLSYALARRPDGAPPGEHDYPSVDSIMRTLRAYQEQTSAFKWNLIFHAVNSVLSSPDSSGRPSPLPKMGYASGRMYPGVGHDGLLPTTILQGCLDFFASV
jgi:hypothetical protein